MPSAQEPPSAEPFFEPLPEPETLVEPRVYPQIPWQPPQNVVPVIAPVSLVLARTEDTVVALTGLDVYPGGVAYTVRTWLRPGTEPDGDDRRYIPWADQPRVGWLLEDGTKVGARLDERIDDTGQPPTVPRVAGTSGTSGGITGAMGYWLYPLPPGDRWTVVVEWPARGIAETRLELDARAVRGAAASSEGELWELPVPPEGVEYGWFGYADGGAAYSSHAAAHPDTAPAPGAGDAPEPSEATDA